MTDSVEVRRGAYHDSVSLMQASRTVAQVPGVGAALVAMATGLNIELLTGMGFATPEDAGPNDLLVAVRAEDDAAHQSALAALAAALLPRPAAPGALAEQPARTAGSAAARRPATLAMVSVPGRYAFAEAMDALEAGLSVLVFSDGVPVAHEVLLKDAAARRDLLVMGPDCGTAIVAGAGLGFANVVVPGPIGIVAASGTGAQQVCCLLDAAGVGVSHVLGVGGRDLSIEVAARSTLQALAALDADPATEVIVVVSKPPAPEVADRVRAAAGALGKPVVLCLLGPGLPDLSAAVAEVLRAAGREAPAWPRWAPPSPHEPRTGSLRGLFCGGTLCDEAMIIAADALGPVASNIPLRPEWALDASLRAPGHLMIDFGEDTLTAGRPHPMIDPSLRTERLLAEGDEPGSAVVLLDVVLGYGAAADPAGDLAPAITAARATATAADRDLAVVVSLCGTEADPQGRDRQATALAAAGAAVFGSNAEAARHAVSLVRRR
ncbi:MAG: FdrA family protein [Pseudonocardiales bacterium]